MYYAAACQTAFECPRERSAIAERVRAMCAMAEQTIIGYEPFHDVRLLAFPEFAHAAPIHDSVKKLRDRLAVRLPNEHTEAYTAFCARHGCYIQTGTFIEMTDDTDVVYNTTALIGPTGVLSFYRKVNPWIPWELHASPHDRRDDDAEPFPVVETELGRIGVAICYDWLFPETIRQIAFNGAEIIIRVSAYMHPWGATAPMDWWTLINRTRAIENTTYVVASNQGAPMTGYPPFSWPGGSMVVDYDGRILAQADPGEGQQVVVAPIHIDALRSERERRIGHDMRSQLRTEIHTYLQQPIMPPAGRHPIEQDEIRRRIAIGRTRCQEESE